MLDEVFAEAIVHRPVFGVPRLCGFSAHKILGLRVRPFSFWHAFNLDLVGAVNLNRISSFASLLLAVRCCRLRYPRTLTHASLWETVCYQLASLRFAFRFTKSWQFWLAQIKQFEDYRKDYADCEAFNDIMPDGGGEGIKLPGYLYQVAMLRRLNPQLTRAQAWNFPIAEAQWEILAGLAAQGAKIDILTPEDRKDIAEMEAESEVRLPAEFGGKASSFNNNGRQAAAPPSPAGSRTS